MALKLAGLTRTAAVVAIAALLAPAACGGGGGTTTTGAPLCAADPGPAPLRRMTRFEYGRTIADLTGVDPSVVGRPPARRRDDGLRRHRDRLQRLQPARGPLPRRGRAGGRDARGRRRPDDGARRLRSERRGRGVRGRVRDRRSGAAPGAARSPTTSGSAMLQLYADTATPGPTDGLVGGGRRRCCSRRSSSTGPSRCRGGGDRRAARRLTRSRPGSRYLLTGAGPDETLLAAAEAGSLATEAGLLAETDRLLAGDRRGRSVRPLRDRSGGSSSRSRRSRRTATSTGPGPTTTPGRARARRRACSWPTPGRARPTLATLLTAPVTFVDASLATFYGLPAPAGAGYQRVALDPTRAAGTAHAGVVPRGARQGRPDLADAARQVRARAAVLRAAPAPAARASW